jgi:hypothetical protein
MRTFARLSAALLLLLAAAVPALAKEGLEARLDRPIALAGDPGSTVTVGFTIAAIGDDPDSWPGQPVFLKVHPVGGAPIESTATDDGRGHYTATFTMPAHGIAAVEIGLRGESCENGVCSRSDFMFQVAGPEGAGVYTPTTVAPPANPGKVADPAAFVPAASAPADPTGEVLSVQVPLTSVPVLPLLALVLIGACAAAALLVTIRRSARTA